MISYKTLDRIENQIIYKSFVEAFSDYQIKISLPFWKFEDMLKRKGYQPFISIGAFENDQLVGFILNGLRIWQGKLTAYDLGTGVIPLCRKKGITSDMICYVKTLLKENQVEQYLLEVLKTNEFAFEIYKKVGFKIERELSCFQLDKDTFIQKKNYGVENYKSLDMEEVLEFWDFYPSWQNSIDSIYAITGAFIYSVVRVNHAIVGYGIIDKRTGDIPQIAVKKEYRGKGIASSIITELIKNSEAQTINVVNIEAQCKGIELFLIKSGFQYEVGQYEMLLSL